MKKVVLILLLLLVGIAIITKPSDKKCIIGGAKAVWGNMMPDEDHTPQLFDYFMNTVSTQIQVKDWVLFKQVSYHLPKGEQTVAMGAFKNVIPLVKPFEHKANIPNMPPQ